MHCKTNLILFCRGNEQWRWANGYTKYDQKGLQKGVTEDNSLQYLQQKIKNPKGCSIAKFFSMIWCVQYLYVCL